MFDEIILSIKKHNDIRPSQSSWAQDIEKYDLSSHGEKKRNFIRFSLPIVSDKDEICSKEKAWDEEVTSGVEKLPRAPMCLLSVICHHYNYNTKSVRLHAYIQQI